jgi:hypothetical protein
MEFKFKKSISFRFYSFICLLQLIYALDSNLLSLIVYFIIFNLFSDLIYSCLHPINIFRFELLQLVFIIFFIMPLKPTVLFGFKGAK